MVPPVASRARTYVEGPTINTTAGTRQTATFRIPLDRHIDASRAYIDVPLAAGAGSATFPMFAGAEGLITDCEAFLGGVSLSRAQRHGHRIQLINAVGAGPTMVDLRAALSGAGGAPTLCYAPPIDSVNATTGAVTYGGIPALTDAGSYARFTSHRGTVARANEGAATPPTQPLPGWRDAYGYVEATSTTATAHGVVMLPRVIPELDMMPYGMLPRLPGQYLEIRMTFDTSLCQDLNVGTGGTAATATIDMNTIRFISKVFEFDPEPLKTIENAFTGYKAAYWSPRLTEMAIAAHTGNAKGDQITQEFNLGFNGEVVGSLLLARVDSAITADQARVVKDLRANPIGRADSSIQVFVDAQSLFHRPLRYSEKWAETAQALGIARLRPPPGTYESMIVLTPDTEATGVHLVYDEATYGPVARKLMYMFSPYAVDLRKDRSGPRHPSNGTPTGRSGIRVRFNRVYEDAAFADGAGTLYAWANVASVLSFSQTAAGLQVSRDILSVA